MRIFNDTALKPAWLVAALDPPRLGATWLVKGTFRLQPGATAAPVEDGEFPTGDLLHEGSPELKYESDFAPFKPRTDLLLAGTCHAPGGNPVLMCPVSFSVGDYTKTLAVVGDRRWRRSSMSAPLPFTSMPIRYERAYGGPQYARNPLGRGHRTDVLPNIEDPDRPITSPSMDAEPAGFAPIPRTWTQRTTRLGSYDEAWLAERWPWFPKDFDARHFNAAPRDQQLRAYLRGDETLVLKNLHPVHPVYQTRLPGIRPQLFVVDGRGPREVPVVLDTLWVDADAETLVLVWRGSLPIESITLADLRAVHVLETAIDAAPCTWDDIVREAHRQATDALHAKVQAEARAAAEEASFEAAMARFRQEAGDAVKAAEANVGNTVAALSADLRALALPPLPALGADLTPEGAAPLAQVIEQAAQDSIAAPIARQLPPVDLTPPEAVAADEIWSRTRCVHHAAKGGSFADQDLSGLNLARLDFSGCDFTRAVLVGTTLTASDLRRCVFTRADLSRAVLDEADLREADLTRADLTAARLTEARLDAACLEHATLEGATLAKASLDDVRATRADFTAAVLDGARLRRGRFFKTNFSAAMLPEADFSHAHLEHALFEGAQGRGATFAGADVRSLHAGNAASFPQASFRACVGDASYWGEACLDGADFTQASLVRADFAFASLAEASFAAANLRQAAFDDAMLDRATLRSANLFRSSLQRTSLRGGDLRGANLYEADVWNCALDDARLERANLQATKLQPVS